MEHSQADIDYLLSPAAIRERAQKIFELTLKDLTHFEYHEDKFPQVVGYVLETIKQNYPDLNIPFHSRWGHFKAGGIDRVKSFEEKIKNLDPLEKARSKIDLVITSVLLDAGAGPDWSFLENDIRYNRSEGLGVASFHMFCDGHFSSDKDNPLQANAKKLENLSELQLEKAFQVSETNPLVGVTGRVELLQNLGITLKQKPDMFIDARPGNLLDYLIEKQKGNYIEATDILKAVLVGFGNIWPGRIKLGETNLGDVWSHNLLGSGIKALVPFHKLSQWLTYSLIEPIMETGIDVIGVEKLTGLAEYRNGGLFIDKEVITLKDEVNYKKVHKPDSQIIIEWRALTICLLDRVAAAVRESLNKKPAEFPLARVLEGGTWWAGRRAAKEKRADGTPPLKLDSDATVF